jgi:UDP-N-acetylglucosamine transferase subunit ALG13
VSTLLVASSGGHLKQLVSLVPRMQGVGDDQIWVTFDTPQSRSLLEGRDVVWAAYTGSRDVKGVAANARLAQRLFRHEPIDRVISSGAGIALSFLPLAAARGIETHYVESAARSLAPSLSGRVLRWVPGVNLYAQYPGAEEPWRYRGSVFDGFDAASPNGRREVRRIVVTLGTVRFGFRRLLDRIVQLVPSNAEVLWQTGHTEVGGLGIEASPTMPADMLSHAMLAADVVVAHAGVGSALAALETGRCPILVPRDPDADEHVDNHQEQIAAELDRRGLALWRSVDSISPEDLEAVAARSVTSAADLPEFVLGR